MIATGPNVEQNPIDGSLDKELQNVKKGDVLGEGTFGKVYNGLYNGANGRIPT